MDAISACIWGGSALLCLFFERNAAKVIPAKELRRYTLLTLGLYVLVWIFQTVCVYFGMELSGGMNTSDISVGTAIYTLFIAAICGPIIEEFLCRFLSLKVLFRLVSKNVDIRARNISVVICTSICFGMMHTGGMVQVLYAIGMGIVFCSVYIKEENILISTYMHVLFNTISVVLAIFITAIPS